MVAAAAATYSTRVVHWLEGRGNQPPIVWQCAGNYILFSPRSSLTHNVLFDRTFRYVHCITYTPAPLNSSQLGKELKVFKLNTIVANWQNFVQRPAENVLNPSTKRRDSDTDSAPKEHMWIYSAHPAPRQNLFRKCREWSGREDPDSCPSLHRNGHSIKRGSRERQNGGIKWNSAKDKNQSNLKSK